MDTGITRRALAGLAGLLLPLRAKAAKGNANSRCRRLDSRNGNRVEVWGMFRIPGDKLQWLFPVVDMAGRATFTHQCWFVRYPLSDHYCACLGFDALELAGKCEAEIMRLAVEKLQALRGCPVIVNADEFGTLGAGLSDV